MEFGGGLLDVCTDLRREFRNQRLVGEFVDVVDRQRRFCVAVGGDARPEHFGGEFVPSGMIRLELFGRDHDVDALVFGLEDGFGQCDVSSDAFEEILL